MKKLFAAAAFSAAGLLSAASAATLTADFDTGAEGFTSPDFALQWLATGGNPDGYIRVEDITGGFGVLLFGPALVVPLEVGGTISFDATLFSATGGNTPDFGELTLSGGGFAATVDMVTGVPPTGSWQTYSVGLDAATFGLSTGDFATMLANIDGIELVIESTFGINEVLGFDNFRVSTADAVPVPAAAFLFAPLAGALAARRRMAR